MPSYPETMDFNIEKKKFSALVDKLKLKKILSEDDVSEIKNRRNNPPSS